MTFSNLQSLLVFHGGKEFCQEPCLCWGTHSSKAPAGQKSSKNTMQLVVYMLLEHAILMRAHGYEAIADNLAKNINS